MTCCHYVHDFFGLIKNNCNMKHHCTALLVDIELNLYWTKSALKLWTLEWIKASIQLRDVSLFFLEFDLLRNWTRNHTALTYLHQYFDWHVCLSFWPLVLCLSQINFSTNNVTARITLGSPPTPGVIPGERRQAFARKCPRSGHFLVNYFVTLKHGFYQKMCGTDHL